MGASRVWVLGGNQMVSGDTREDLSYGRTIRLCGVVTAAIGLFAAVGWSLGRPLLSSLGEGNVPMAPPAAVLFVAYGTAVLLRARRALNCWAIRCCAAIGCAGVVAASLLLYSRYQGIYPQAEHLGFTAVGLVGGAPIGHSSPGTALGFVVAGLSLLLSLPSASRWQRWRAAAGWCLAWLLFAAFFVMVLAYLYGTPLMYGTGLVPPSATTSLAFVALGTALLALAGPQLWQRGEGGEGDRRSESTLLLVFVMLAGGIVAAGYFYFASYQARFRGEVERELSSITDLKVSQLVQYRRERLGDASVFLGNTTFAMLVARVLDQPSNRRARARLEVWVGQYESVYQYDRITLLDSRGTDVVSVPEGSVPVASVIRSRVPEVLGSRQVVIHDFHRNENDGRVYLTMMVPIFGGGDGRRPLGVLVLRIDPEEYLYPFIKRWPTPSATAESLLVRRDGNDVLFLNDLQFAPNAALSLRIPLDRQEVPAVKAVLGQQGIVEGVDYRGVPVIADVRPVPDSPWFVVAREDLAEAYLPLRERIWTTVVLVSVLLVGAGASVWGVWRQQRSRFYRERYEAERDRVWLQDVVARSLNEVYVFDPDTLGFSFANAGACRNIGYTTAELTRLTPLDLKPEFTEETFRAMLRPLLTGERDVLVFDTVHRRKDASEYPVEVHLQLVESGKGMVFLALVNDITERKHAQLALQRQRNLYDMLAQTNQVIARCKGRDQLFAESCRIAVDNGRFSFAWIGVADAKARLVLPVVKYGEDAGYVSELRVWVDPSEGASRGPTGSAFRTGRHAVANDFHADPAVAPWHAAAQRAGVRASAAFPIHERGVVVGTISLYAGEVGLFTPDVLATLDEMVNDISLALDNFALEADRASAVEALRQSESRYRDLVENSQDLICTHDMQGTPLLFNDAAVRLTGYPRDTLLRMNLAELIDGTTREQFAAYLTALREHGHVSGVIRMHTAAGELRSWEYDSVLREDGAAGPIVRVMAHDVTDRLNAERERRALEVQLRSAQKMEALGTLSGGIAHDFNNILGAIIGNVALAQQDVGADHPAVESLEEIRKASLRAKELVQRILTFGRQQPQPQTVIALRPVVEEAVLLLRAILPSGIELATAFDRETPTALADPTDIHQILINLCTNAWQAMDGQAGRIEIALDGVTLDSEAAAGHPDLRPGRYARLSVIDAGSGMDAATLERMFEPFFTTKSVGQGTGLGLSVVHGIVKAHGGAIIATSKPGIGTTIRVYFPAVDAPVPEVTVAESGAQPLAAAAGQRVLYVDDEEALVFLVTRTLERLGFRVSGYTRAQEAVAAVRADPGYFDLAITDFNMPGMSGLDVARELLRLRPDLPVVMASGYITDALREQAAAAGVAEMIYKPNTVEELCEVVQRVAAATGRK